MTSHIFITTKYLDKCLDTGLFGVTDTQINHLSNVREKDTVFILETKSMDIVGPFEIVKSLFYNETPVWEKTNDKFKYRVKFKSEEVWRSDVSSLWSVLLNRKSNEFYSFTTFQRSNNTLLPGEGDKLISILRKNGQPKSPDLKSEIVFGKVDLIKKEREKHIHNFSSEARLETALLLNKSTLIDILKEEGIVSKNSHPFIINQVTLPGINYNIDIAIFDEEHVIIIELKKDKVDKATNNQLKKYSKYWELAEIPVKLVAIGKEIVDRDGDDEVKWFTYDINLKTNSLNINRDKSVKYSISL